MSHIFADGSGMFATVEAGVKRSRVEREVYGVLFQFIQLQGFGVLE